ncbi:MAG: Y4hR [uncultured Caballeronia sp.]|nr:MAG: Y4hR [uncultured Caballeronia sp.]
MLDRLYQRDLIGDPVNKTKSVILTDEGLRESERLFNLHSSCRTRTTNNKKQNEHPAQRTNSIGMLKNLNAMM